MKILLVNDTTDWCHWGCTATSTILIERMKALKHKVESFPARESYSGAWPSRPNTLEGFKDKSNFDKFAEHNPILVKKLNAADAIIINGEGTLHELKEAPLNLLYLAYISKIFLDKHLEIINHSVFPEDTLNLDNEQTCSLYQRVYQLADYIAVREPLSLELLNKLGIKATLSFDCLPIYIKKYYQQKSKVESKNIVFSGSAAWQDSNTNLLIDFVHLISQQGYKIIFLVGAKSYHVSDSQLVTFLDDDKFINFFKNNLSSINYQIVNANSINEWLDTIANANILVSGRFHHTIAACCLGTPFIALNSNTPKLDGLMELLEMPHTLQYNDKDLLNKLMRQSEEILHHSRTNNAKNILNKLCKLAEYNFSHICYT